MINIKNGTENDKQKLLNDYPNLHKFFGDNGYLIVAEKENDIIGFLWLLKEIYLHLWKLKKCLSMQLKYLIPNCAVKE